MISNWNSRGPCWQSPGNISYRLGRLEVAPKIGRRPPYTQIQRNLSFSHLFGRILTIYPNSYSVNSWILSRQVWDKSALITSRTLEIRQRHWITWKRSANLSFHVILPLWIHRRIPFSTNISASRRSPCRKILIGHFAFGMLTSQL